MVWMMINYDGPFVNCMERPSKTPVFWPNVLNSSKLYKTSKTNGLEICIFSVSDKVLSELKEKSFDCRYQRFFNLVNDIYKL